MAVTSASTTVVSWPRQQRLDHPLRDDLAGPGHSLGRAAQEEGTRPDAGPAAPDGPASAEPALSSLRGLRLGVGLSDLRLGGGAAA